MILFVLPFQKLNAQSTDKLAIERLKSTGFEEVRIVHDEAKIICTIERGLYRTPADDFRNALTRLRTVYPDSCQVVIILTEQGQPVYQLFSDSGNKNSIQPAQARPEPSKPGDVITWYDQKIFQKVKNVTVQRSVHRGVTLTIFPQVAMRSLLIESVYQKQFNLAPAVQYSAWRGMLLTGQVIFPLYNQLGYTDNFIRPGFVTFSQNFSLPRLNNLKLTAGNFNKYRYGFDLQYKKRFQHSRWTLGANLGLTGTSMIYDRYWHHSSINTISWNVKTGYYLPTYQMQADLQIGQFLTNDRGFRFDVYRHFGEVTIGAWVSSSVRVNGGFHFAIPLDPFKRKHNSRFRIKLPDTFDDEYRARNDFVYGLYYETRPDENRSVQDLPSQLINNNFINH